MFLSFLTLSVLWNQPPSTSETKMDFNSLKKVQIVSKMDANLVTSTSVAQSAFVSSAQMSSVPNTSSLIFLDNSIILPNDQPDILQQALAEVALPSSVSVTSSPAIIPTNLFVTSKIEFSNSPIFQFSNLKCCIKAKEHFKTPF